MEISKKKNNRNFIIDGIEALLVFGIVVCMIFIIIQVNHLQGTARVVNYTGIVRGATQRLVKLELMNESNLELEHRLDTILNDLQIESGGSNNLILLPDKYYQECLSKLADAWVGLKSEMDRLRKNPGNHDAKQKVLSLSEEYFNLADNTVSAAEDYSQTLATKTKNYEIIISIIMALEVMIIIYKSISSIYLVRKNRELDRLAYIDAHTGLPNKSRCQQYLNSNTAVPPHTAVFVFDLNYLKKVNDELGHDAGDNLIRNFAALLRSNLSSENFIGRFGGDEFMVVANSVTHQSVENLCEKLIQAENNFNKIDHGYILSFSYGYALSDDFMDCTYQILFDMADHNMYEYKKAIKAKTGEDLR